MKRLIKVGIILGLFGLVLQGCYPEQDFIASDYDLAITHYNPDQNFSGLNTFYMYDTVIHIMGDNGGSPNRQYDTHILNQLRQNLLDYGWTEITDTTNNRDNIDVAVFASILSTDVYTYYYYWYDYWYWYPWGYYYYPYDPFYSYYYYPGYYSGYTSYSYSLGTIICEMINISNLQGDTPKDNIVDVTVPIVWTGAINGIMAGSNSGLELRITKQMDQLFEQSPYLMK